MDERKRVPLYERLPEIYRIRDQEQEPPHQLKHYLALVEGVFGAIHANIEQLYRDLFIETSDNWVIPYIGDLLGTSHLTGDPWTLRADVADTIALRRRKGTLASIERLTYDLTQWGVHCVELRQNLVWNQRLNHQRPDAGGEPPYAQPGVTRFTPVRGGTVPVRDPAMLSLLNTPFDPFAHTADLKPPAFGAVRYNLPNLAIFLWRLKDYRAAITQPVFRGTQVTGAVDPGAASHVVRFDVNPLGYPVRLFNTYQFDPDRDPPVITGLDGTPGPILAARLTSGSEAGNPARYVAVDVYDPASTAFETRDIADAGLQLHIPEPEFTGETFPGPPPETWTIRGANLCAWEDGLKAAVQNREIVIDSEHGRLLIGVAGTDEAGALEQHLRVTYTYGAVGPVGAHPISRPQEWNDVATDVVLVNYHDDPDGLRAALDDLAARTAPLVIEIRDSMTHDLDLAAITGALPEDGGPNLFLNHSLIIRAADGERPVIRLAQPLRARPQDVTQAHNLTLRLEGLHIARASTFPAGEPLIARAALNRLEIMACTLDPGGYQQLDGTRAPTEPSLDLRHPYGFDPGEEAAFDQTPEIVIERSITGPLLIDSLYTLFLAGTLIDAGKGVNDDPGDSFGVSGATDAVDGWGPPTQVNGITVLGRMRVTRIDGRGGIWVHRLEVQDNQRGCLRYSYFSGDGDRLPQNLGCVRGPEAALHFTNEIFGQPAYGQLRHTSDFRIRERGPDDDAMGAFGFLLEAHKWRNIQIRFREFMPVGIVPLLIPVT